MGRVDESGWSKIRNLTGFWILGLCNNFGYVVMLSAAQDVLLDIPSFVGNEIEPAIANRTGKLIPKCSTISTGAVLLADILPTLIVKLTAPFCIHSIPYWFKVSLVTISGLASFPIVAISEATWVSLLGVVFASISSGLGEITFLCLSSFYHRDVVSTWSSGTGAAGLFGALSYAGLIALGLSARNTLFLMTVMPALLGFTYFLLLTKPTVIVGDIDINDSTESVDTNKDGTASSYGTGPTIERNDTEKLNDAEKTNYNDKTSVTDKMNDTAKTPLIGANVEKSWTRWLHEYFSEKWVLVKPLMKFMIPMGIVYFAAYFINQGLQELVYFDGIWLPIVQQYRWYQVIYQLGVVISRSSVNCFHIKKLWILPILQCMNVVLMFFQIFYHFLPSIWLVFAIILYEGLLGGASYVNTFYAVAQQTEPQHLEYSMTVALIAETAGISLAGGVAIPVHNLMCTL